MKCWKTYKNEKYDIQFKYPPTWEDAQEEENPSNEMTQVDYLNVKFDEKYAKRVELSKISAYGDKYKEDTDLLLRVYNKTAEDIKPFILPPQNAAIQANTIPRYIESSNKKWRGISFFANIGNGYSTGLAGVAIMTDGGDNIAEFIISEDSNKSSDYPCINDSTAGCSGDDVESTAKRFWDYVNSINEESSDEPVIKNFYSTSKKVIDSIETL